MGTPSRRDCKPDVADVVYLLRQHWLWCLLSAGLRRRYALGAPVVSAPCGVPPVFVAVASPADSIIAGIGHGDVVGREVVAVVIEVHYFPS